MSMMVLDTDHLTLFEWADSPEARRLRSRLDQIATEDRATTIVTYEEQSRGWLAFVRKSRTISQEVEAYRRLHRHLRVFQRIIVLPFEETEATIFQRLKKSRLLVGTMDLKIAAITLAHDATLLTRNTADFRIIPGLKFEDWTA